MNGIVLKRMRTPLELRVHSKNVGFWGQVLLWCYSGATLVLFDVMKLLRIFH